MLTLQDHFKMNSDYTVYTESNVYKSEKSDPLWIIVEVMNTTDELDIRKINKNVKAYNKQYNLCCIYNFHMLKSNFGHFKGIFWINDNFFLVDNLQSNTLNEIKIEKDFKCVMNCVIYYLS